MHAPGTITDPVAGRTEGGAEWTTAPCSEEEPCTAAASVANWLVLVPQELRRGNPSVMTQTAEEGTFLLVLVPPMGCSEALIEMRSTPREPNGATTAGIAHSRGARPFCFLPADFQGSLANLTGSHL